MLRYALRGEGRDEIGVVEVREPHVADLGVICAGHDLEEVMVFGDTFDRIPRELHRPELQLAFHDGGRRDVGEGFAGIFKVGDVVFSRLVERHEGAQELRESPRNGDVVARGSRRDRGLLHVQAREAEDQGPVRQEYALEGLPKRAVQGDLVGQKVHVFDLIGEARAHAGTHGHGGLGKLDLQDQVELRRQHLAATEHADEVRRHEHVALLPGLHRQRPAAGIHRQPLPQAPLPPLLVFQQAVHEGRTAVVADIFHALPVGEELNSFNETARIGRAAQHVAGAVRVAEGKRQLYGLWIDEIDARGDRNAAHPAGARGKSAQRAWEELHRLAGLNVVGVARGQLVVEAGDELVIDGLRHLLHPFT